MKQVRLEDIRIDGGTQFRDEIDQALVKDYAEKMASGVAFPPIKATFDGTTYWLYDGFHRYFAWQEMGKEVVDVVYKPGTQEDAQDLALSANDDHGLPRNNATKRKSVLAALAMERHKGKNNTEIAKLCKVSDKFVASVRDPEAKKKQAKNVERHFEKKIKERDENPIKSDLDPKPSILDGNEPSEEELMANDLAMQADLDTLNKLLEADEPLKVAHEEIKRLNYLLAQQEVRIASLMREKSECIKLCKKQQAQLDKFYKAQK